MVEVSLSFLKTLKLVGKMSPFFIDEFSQDSVPQMKSGLCRLFSTSMSAAFFLMLWQLIRMHLKFDLLVVLCPLLFLPFFDDLGFLILIWLTLSRGSNWFDVRISVSSKKEFEKLK